MIEKLRCCYMYEDGLQCQKLPELWIGKNGVDDYTHSCTKHCRDLRTPGDVVLRILSQETGSRLWHYITAGVAAILVTALLWAAVLNTVFRWW